MFQPLMILWAMNRELICTLILALFIFAGGCSQQTSDSSQPTVPHEGAWGIYSLELSTENIELIYSSASMEVVGLHLNPAGTTLAFSLKSTTTEAFDPTSEIYIVGVDGSNPTRLTNNSYFDTYPSFSPNGSKIAFLSKRNGTLDLYVMNADGSGQQLLYDSGGHDADICWGSNDRIAFTRDHQIWTVSSDGTDPQQVTDPPNAGEWGDANLPIGDYDPRTCPSARRIAFERMVDVSSVNGGYDIFVVTATGTAESRLTTTGYSQGFANWSCDGMKLVFIVAAIDGEGKYDLYMMDSDGSNNRNITPNYFPAEFLCHNAVFSADDSKIYFIGQWYGDS